MFEHKNLDGQWNKTIPATDSFVNGEVLECRDTVGEEPAKISRKQYAVIGDLLVERCLPPESIGDTWAHDVGQLPWWGAVMNPPHAGMIADFNSLNGGLQRRNLDVAHHVVGYAAAGEEITLLKTVYSVTRASDGKELSAPSMLELRKLYYA
ncbi:hypothetical protein ACQE3E_10305 [Methylomonas sp. MED-D]|uniref:Uncharacterized protein n=1 Tax=Methylomonas koyamae TaxID=702114 RepID=A0A177P0M6_9GAMM|nr:MULTISPECIES: hypothetical protein [Methylomonas]NJA06125.1 hypothetical protein [Methylococcaceae bacterium WWC4]MDT4328680.1 hypothetical protein [Methylomonas sp. MV1]OAI22979.1 hypothetical protein A1355_22090 [Methylomonas koyamae]OHX34495.1 hypothetical protein BJL95_17435 [Methylomonas sp. LWB]WGS88087.1 hypothetical protein QC632_10075 [Methylomonas sp. UP202]